MLRRNLLVLWTGLLLALLPLQSWAAGGHKTSGSSLLPECQGAAALPSPDCGKAPSAVFDGDGRLWLVFSQNGHVYLTYSDDLGEQFTPPTAVNRVPETIRDDGENRPKLVLGNHGELFVSWTRRIPGKYAGDIRFARASNADAQFDDPLTINDDRAQISHRFESLAMDSQGRLFISWLDKRDQEAAKESGERYNGAAVYFTFSEDHGASFAPDRKLADSSCECCRIAIDVDRNDRVAVLWRHIYPGNIRDHSIAFITPTTDPIAAEPVRATDDGWEIEGCPHQGPDLAFSQSVNGLGKAHITWFSQGEKNRGVMYGRFDIDRGVLELQQSMDATAGASRPQVLAQTRRVWRAWKSFDGTSTTIRLADSTDEGQTWSPARVVAETGAGSDHPDLIAYGDRPFLAWHTQAEGFRLIPLRQEKGVVRHGD